MNMSQIMDQVLSGGDSSNDQRFQFEVGQKVRIKSFNEDQIQRWGTDHSGKIATILSRRNGYPPSAFVDIWFPLYWTDVAGDLGESMLEEAIH